MTEQKKTPKLRFPGFTDDWEQRKLGEMAQFSKGTGYSKRDLKESGTPIILYGRLYTKYETVITDVDTFVDEKTGSVFSSGGEVIVPASGETAEDISIASVVEKSGVLLGGDLNIITPSAELDSAFLAISISNGKPHHDMAKMAQGKTVVHLHNTDLEKIDLAYPSHEEQMQISGFFRGIDNLITLHQHKCEAIKKYKMAMLQKMFPRNESLIPEIRFPGFTDNWEQRKLSELLEERHAFTKITDRYPRLSFTIEEGVISPEDRKTNKRDFLMKDEANKKFLITEVGDIIYNPANVVYGAIHRNSLKNGCLSPIYRIFVTQQDSKFMECVVRSPLFISKLAHRTEGSVVKLKTLKPEAFLDMDVNIAPSIEEQAKIADFIYSIDNTITLHQREYKKYEELKKGLLQQILM